MGPRMWSHHVTRGMEGAATQGGWPVRILTSNRVQELLGVGGSVGGRGLGV